MQQRSISQRLKRAKSTESKISTLVNWSKSWEGETFDLICQIERGIRTNNYDLLCRATGQLKAVSEKHFKALPNVLTHFVPDQPESETDTFEIAPETLQIQPELEEIEPSPEPQKSIPMPSGYISAREWSIKNNKSPKRGQKILTDWPNAVPSAIKVKNPRGGVDIWAVPEDTEWPF